MRAVIVTALVLVAIIVAILIAVKLVSALKILPVFVLHLSFLFSYTNYIHTYSIWHLLNVANSFLEKLVHDSTGKKNLSKFQ